MCPFHFPSFTGKIQGSNARCVALMLAMKQLISDYTLTPNTEISRDLESKLKPNISFIDICRSLSVSQVTMHRPEKPYFSPYSYWCLPQYLTV